MYQLVAQDGVGATVGQGIKGKQQGVLSRDSKSLPLWKLSRSLVSWKQISLMHGGALGGL